MSIIETKKLTFKYEGSSDEILHELTLEIEKGSFTAILGRNGSGKSTLAKHFNAILLPCGGNVYVDGADTKNEKMTFDIRRKVGMVFQNPDNQIVATTVEEDVAFGLENLGVEHDEMVKRVEKALKTVDMYEKRKFAPHLLSGGQKQRVAIAGIIAMEPEVIVFDEPTAMLDPKGRKEVMETIKTLKNELGITVVMITHYMDEAAKADRVVVIDKGETVLDDTPGKVFSQTEKMLSLGLDVPQVTLLCKMLNEKGIDIDTDILRTSQCAEKLNEILNARRG
jgi:energy-coupling factor transport system ATP-binding protein